MSSGQLTSGHRPRNKHCVFLFTSATVCDPDPVELILYLSGVCVSPVTCGCVSCHVWVCFMSRVSVFPVRCVLPCVHHTGDVSSQGVWAGQSAEEVQVDGAENSNRPVRATTEDQLIRDRQTGGLRRLRTDR